jgi:hypothetical protein
MCLYFFGLVKLFSGPFVYILSHFLCMLMFCILFVYTVSVMLQPVSSWFCHDSRAVTIPACNSFVVHFLPIASIFFTLSCICRCATVLFFGIFIVVASGVPLFCYDLCCNFFFLYTVFVTIFLSSRLLCGSLSGVRLVPPHCVLPSLISVASSTV